MLLNVPCILQRTSVSSSLVSGKAFRTLSFINLDVTEVRNL